MRWSGAALFAAIVVALVVSLLASSSQAFAHSGLSFFWSGTSNATKDVYPTGVFILGTLITTAVAIILAVPIGAGTAAFLSEFAPRWLATPLSVAIDLIAAVPSIVVGLWGLLVLQPIFTHHVEPVMKKIPVFEWFFHGPALGPSMFLAGTVLAVMILPTIVALSPYVDVGRSGRGPRGGARARRHPLAGGDDRGGARRPYGDRGGSDTGHRSRHG